MEKKANTKFIIAFFIFILFLSTFFIGKQYFSLENVQHSLGRLETLYGEHDILFVILYMTLYVLIAAFGIPAATVMTLLGGVIFGFVQGSILASFASTLGATLSFLLARFLLGDWVQQRFGNKLAVIQEGIRKDGPYYLFTLRLIPIFPFFAINVLMGLTPMKTWTFYWVSQLGMLGATMVYVNAGKQLAQITSLEGILSWKVILSFSLLGVFPLLAKKIIGYTKCIQK